MTKSHLAEAVDSLAAETFRYSAQDLEKPWAWGSYDAEGVRFAFFRTYEELRQLAAALKTQRTIATPPISQAQTILGGYQAAFLDLQALMVGISDQAGEDAPAGEWSQKLTLAHIIESEQGFFYVIQHALGLARGTQTSEIELTEEAWNAFWPFDPSSQEGGGHSLSALLAYYQTLNTRVSQEFSSITDAELEYPSRYWEDTPMMIRFRLHRLDSHLRQHTIQVEKIQTALGTPTNEARRLLRLIYNALAEVQGALLGAPQTGIDAQHALAQTITERTGEIAAITAKA